MPIKVRKVRNQNSWRVFDDATGEVYSKVASYEEAHKQKSLLEENNKVKKKVKFTDDEVDEKLTDIIDKTKAVIKVTKKKTTKSKK
jgi:hypothetical protein